MSSLDVIHKLRQRLHATAAAKPNQWHTGVAMLRFLALMFLLTLLVRGTAATTLPVVSVTAPYQGVVTQSFTVSGQISPGIGTPLTIPEGLLVEQIFVQPGDQVTEGQTLALLSLDDVRAEIEQVQASMQQHQVQANQLLAGQAADPFAWQQAQQQLDRAYADYQQAAAEGEADVSQAQNVLDAAHQVLAEVEGRKPQRPYEDGFWEMATPEQAQTEQDYADWEAEYATAQAAVQQAQADLEAAQEAADNATEAALSAAQNAEDHRAHNLNHLASLLGSVLGGLLCALGKLLSFLLGSSFRLHGVGGGADLLVTVHAADSMRGSFNGVCLFFGRQSLLLCGTVIRGVCRLIYTCFFPASRCRGGMA